MQLRPYQNDQLNLLRQGIAAKQYVQMLMSPTGSGKNEVAKAHNKPIRKTIITLDDLAARSSHFAAHLARLRDGRQPAWELLETPEADRAQVSYVINGRAWRR